MGHPHLPSDTVDTVVVNKPAFIVDGLNARKVEMRVYKFIVVSMKH